MNLRITYYFIFFLLFFIQKSYSGDTLHLKNGEKILINIRNTKFKSLNVIASSPDNSTEMKFKLKEINHISTTDYIHYLNLYDSFSYYELDYIRLVDDKGIKHEFSNELIKEIKKSLNKQNTELIDDRTQSNENENNYLKINTEYGFLFPITNTNTYMIEPINQKVFYNFQKAFQINLDYIFSKSFMIGLNFGGINYTTYLPNINNANIYQEKVYSSIKLAYSIDLKPFTIIIGSNIGLFISHKSAAIKPNEDSYIKEYSKDDVVSEVFLKAEFPITKKLNFYSNLSVFNFKSGIEYGQISGDQIVKTTSYIQSISLFSPKIGFSLRF